MFLLDFESGVVQWVLSALAIVLSIICAGHALLWKRDPRAAVGWIAVCLLLPGLGALLYWLFGVNRIRAQAQYLRRRWPLPDNSDLDDPSFTAEWPSEHLGFTRLSRKVTRRRFVEGNHIELLVNGEEAFPAMLDEIRNAQVSIGLCTYIFDSDRVGLQFVDALADAVERGVEVKVLVDGLGELYSRPRISRFLKERGIPTARFMPWNHWQWFLNLNLRNHRKIMVVDGRLAFTGGMNIGVRHLAEAVDNPKKALDLHFKVSGPVVADIEWAFLEDWSFATGANHLRTEPLDLPGTGDLLARVIIDGPNEDFEKLRWMYMGATNAARQSVRVMTPYFVPDRELMASLNAAAMRGVNVEIILPEEGNIPFVSWATDAMLWQVLERGVKVCRQPAPFTHSKLFIVDDSYAIVGSGNFDDRSLRLNFEFNLEIYDKDFVSVLVRHFDEAKARSASITLAEMDARPWAVKFRDGFARLFAPYL
ncbi:cardiolipin synthase [Hoeflea prorocentri]|uniref:Cardiolipin synthase n=1 Tax=Hoeflea prorocentri TaxID=1922333 RepID=A0A9X3ZIK1_9HYPH|nr:cardiolipin synthase [Hoeflea prorocentri]MCY6382529.1 cardiolipin synthase [Hoeflea prorocentri]MDA5400329.1 cardiolipin synthase [Hoeflea prorocentri]